MIDYIVVGIIMVLLLSLLLQFIRKKHKGQHSDCGCSCNKCSSSCYLKNNISDNK